jgi:phosphatidate cytidylyltransferase
VSELFKRILVAVIGIPLTVFLIFAGGIPFTVAVAIISSMALIELFKFFRKKGLHPFTKTAIFANLLFIVSTYLYIDNIIADERGKLLFPAILIFIIILFMLTGLWSKKQNTTLNVMASLGGMFYISVTFIFLILLRQYSDIYIIAQGELSIAHNLIAGKEPEFLLSLLIAIWVCDTAAYFVGKSVGKHKLFPSVSPKKTWEGAIGGFFGAVAGFYICTQLPILLKDFPLSHAIIIGIIIGVTGQLGDLAESKLKRDTGIKDSSAVLPGHGGILDRFDSIMFVIPFVFIYLYFVNL